MAYTNADEAPESPEPAASESGPTLTETRPETVPGQRNEDASTPQEPELPSPRSPRRFPAFPRWSLQTYGWRPPAFWSGVCSCSPFQISQPCSPICATQFSGSMEACARYGNS